MDMNQPPNQDDARAQRATVNALKRQCADEGRPAEIARLHSRGKMSVRERITALCDAESFREFGMLVQPARETDMDAALNAPADGIVTGVGRIDGRLAAVAGNDPSVVGGSSGKVGMAKLERIVKRAIDSGMPLIRMLEGGGHRIQEGLDSRHFSAAHGIFQSL